MENRDKDSVTVQMREANAGFRQYMATLREKKGDCQLMKQANDEYRKQIAQDIKDASQFKFTKMTRKPPFKSLTHAEGFINRPQTVVPIHQEYMDGREKEALIFPPKIKDNTK